MDDMRAQSAMQMIMHAGDARALAMQALDALNTFDVEGAREKLKEANKEVVEAHKIQTEAIVDRDKRNSGRVFCTFLSCAGYADDREYRD